VITPKKWYTSKILWAAVVTMLLGIVPLVLDFNNSVPLVSIPFLSALLTLVSGILTLVWRLFFTNQPIL
jgi:hypothetical protein